MWHLDHIFCVVPSCLDLRYQRAEPRWETARWQTACCRQTQHNTAAVSLSDGWAWYRCNPVKAFWRITMSNSKPCNMHYNNKGILQTYFNLAARQTGDWHDSRSLLRSPPSVITFPPSTHFLAVCPSLSTSRHWMSTRPSITISLPFTPFHCRHGDFFSSPALICLLTPPSCQSVSAGLTSLASYLMSQWCNYRSRHFRNQIGFLGHFTAIFFFLLAADLHDLHVSWWKKQIELFFVFFTGGAARRRLKVDVLTFAQR